MAVRLRIGITFGDKEIETVAVANAGYETPTPEIVVPHKLASSAWKGRHRGARSVRYKTAAGTAKFRVLGKARVRVKCPDTESQKVDANLLVSNIEDEVLLNDKLIEKLGVTLVACGEGKWKFRYEPLEVERDSEMAERW